MLLPPPRRPAKARCPRRPPLFPRYQRDVCIDDPSRWFADPGHDAARDRHDVPRLPSPPSPDPIATVIKSGEQSEPASSTPAEANAPGENPAAAKAAKKRAAARAANLGSVNPAAADGDPAATAASPADAGHPAAAAKPVAPKRRRQARRAQAARGFRRRR